MGLSDMDEILVSVRVFLIDGVFWFVSRFFVSVLMVWGMFVMGVLMCVVKLVVNVVKLLFVFVCILVGGRVLMLCGVLGVFMMVNVLLVSVVSCSLLFFRVCFVVCWVDMVL